MTNSLKNVPVNVTEARFIIESMNTVLDSISILEKMKGLNDRNKERRFLAENFKKKLEIMFEEELKDE